MNLDEVQQYFYDRGQYGEIARRVDTCLRIQDKGCAGGPNAYGEHGPDQCDEGKPCVRHSNVVDIEARYHRRFCK